MKKIVKTISFLLSLLSVFVFTTISYYNNILPSNIAIYDDETIKFNSKIAIKSENIQKTSAVAKSYANNLSNYESKLKLLGVFPIKTVDVKVVKQRYVALSGESFGIKIFTKGVMVVGMSDVKTKEGSANPAKESGLKIGDIILKVNGFWVNSNTELSEKINSCKGQTIKLNVKRENDVFDLKLIPATDVKTGEFKAGLWVRDSSAGLGTMTFYSTVNGAFAGLGHPIVDVDTKMILPINSGEVVKTEIISVEKAKSGQAGELCGTFTGEKTGRLIKNCDCGIYGFYEEYDKENPLVLVANKQDVKTGNAKILTTIDNNGAKYYDCVIERVDLNDKNQKNLLIKITDESLIEKTGGIVQGMSGSPVLQDGKLVGALTNVFVNDATKGYAIFADTMLETAQNLANQQLNKAS